VDGRWLRVAAQHAGQAGVEDRLHGYIHQVVMGAEDGIMNIRTFLI
jgi:hypothetical protein